MKKEFKNKRRKCKECKEVFEQQRPLQYLCGVACSLKYSKKLTEKKERKELSEAKKSLLTHKDYLKLAQVAFNNYIRKRDKEKGCISCGVSLEGTKYDAGHYLSVGANPALRFYEKNVHGQCVHCNQHLHGNLINYRKGLIIRMGEGVLEYLESEKKKHTKLTIPELKDLAIFYKQEIKKLK